MKNVPSKRLCAVVVPLALGSTMYSPSVAAMEAGAVSMVVAVVFHRGGEGFHGGGGYGGDRGAADLTPEMAPMPGAAVGGGRYWGYCWLGRDGARLGEVGHRTESNFWRLWEPRRPPVPLR